MGRWLGYGLGGVACADHTGIGVRMKAITMSEEYRSVDELIVQVQ